MIGIPATMSATMIDSPITKATIWLRVRLDVKRPIATKDAVRKTVPTYWAMTAPLSKSPAVWSDMGMTAVASTPAPTKTNPARNLDSSTVHVLRGWVNSISSVPSRCSSATSRIVAAGTNTASIHGSRVKSGLIEASWVISAVRKNM